MKKLPAIAILFSLAAAVTAAEYQVDVNNGDDNGEILRTFEAALAKAAPGDTIRILPADRPINASLVIENKSGAPDKPIVIDAMFNTFVGTKPVNLAEWHQIEPGLYHTARTMSGGLLGRFNMIFNGEMQRMGRTVKWQSPPLKKVSELQDYEWTIINKKDIYFRIPKDLNPAEADIREPIGTDSGVMLTGNSSHITVRNMIVKNFWNDGFNIHFDCKDILFENVAAIDNYDDGISAHEECEVTVRNMYARGNGTGICHIEEAVVTHENVYIAPGMFGADVYLLNKENILRNVIVEGTSPRGVEFAKKSQNVLESCVFVWPDQRRFIIGAEAVVRITGTVIDSPVADKRVEALKSQLREIFGAAIVK